MFEYFSNDYKLNLLVNVSLACGMHVDDVDTTCKDLRDRLEAGEFNSRFDAEIVVVALTSYISGLKTAWLSDIVSMSPESLSLTDRIEELADLFIFGINKD